MNVNATPGCFSFYLPRGIVIKSIFYNVYPNLYALETGGNVQIFSVPQYMRCSSNHLQQVFHMEQKCSCTNLTHLVNKERGYSAKSVLTNGKSSNTIGCRNKRLFAQNDDGCNYKFHLETKPEGMRPYRVKETETCCRIQYSVKGRLYVHTDGGGRGRKRGGGDVFHLKTISVATFM